MLATAAWFVSRGSRAPEVGNPAVDATAFVGRDESVGGVDPELLPSVGYEGTAENERSPMPAVALEAKSERRVQLPADALWIEGRVRFPAGTPTDEDMRVVASGRRFMSLDKRRTHAAPLEQDGSFRVAFAPKTLRGSLDIRARFAYLDSKYRLRLPLPEAPVVLEPAWGACVQVDLVLPQEIEGLRVEPIEVVLRTRSGGARAFLQGERVGAGRYEIGGVPPEGKCRLEVTSPAFVDHTLDVETRSAGRITTLEVRPRPGVRITGRVVDEQGAGIAQAELTAGSRRAWIHTESDAEGRFTLAGIPPGELSLSAKHERHLPLDLELGEAADGDRREDLRLVLPNGDSLAGQVFLPDGEPVAGAKIEVLLTDSEEWSVEKTLTSIESDGEGRFRLTGLHSGEYWLRASLEDESLEAVQTCRADDLRVERWAEEREAVMVPGPEVDFIVRAGHELRGRVVDDRGHAIDNYLLSVLSVDLRSIQLLPGESFELGTGRIGRWRVRSDTGEFVVCGVPGGDWELLVSAHDHSNESRRIRVPMAEELLVTLARDAHLSGTVVGPDGAPVAQATVKASRVFDSQPDWVPDQTAGKTETDERGRFKLEPDPGTWRLQAEARDHGSSPAWEVTLGPGEVIEDARMTLTRPGAVHVTLHSDFAVRSEARVKLHHARGGTLFSLKLRPGQSHDIEDLDPGEYSLTVASHHRTVYFDRGDEVELAVNKPGEVLLREEIRVDAGERVQVVLGRPSSDYDTRVRGRVIRCGEAAPGVHLQWRCIETGWVGFAHSDVKGDYELGLAGKRSFEVRISTEDSGWSSHDVDVEAGASEFSRDFDLPCGSISGIVLGDAGKPMSWVEVSVARREPGGWSSYFNALTGSDGRFSIGPLETGTYVLRAEELLTATSESGGSFRTTLGRTRAPRHGILRVDGIQVPSSGPVEGLDLRLPPAATLRVRTRTRGGSIVAGAKLSIEYADGLRAGVQWTPNADAFGRAELHGLGPGDYLLHATLNDSESERVPVTVAEGERVEVELLVLE